MDDKSANRKFCSRKCKEQWASQNIRGENHPNWKGKIKRVCKFCGKEFQVFPWIIKERKGKFCSYKCHGKWMSENLKEKNGLHWKGGKIARYCIVCGKKFTVSKCFVKKDKAKFCSRKCQGQWKSKNIRGKNHHNWQGGLSFEPYGIEFNNKLRKQIRKRDNYICQECGLTQEQLGYKLSVHHIDYNKKNNKPDNLISLCRSCHLQTNYKRKDWTQYFQDKLTRGENI